MSLIAEILLSRGKRAIVDDEDYDRVNQFKWYYGGNGYARRDTMSSRMKTRLYMHRIIMNCPDDMHVDHINHNTLDNRKMNLRLCTHQQNHFNLKTQYGTSKHKGVSWDKENGKWVVRIRMDNAYKNLGRFTSETDAAIAYNNAAKEYHAEFAFLNTITQKENE